MKEGYIVINNSNYGLEFFGVYKNKKTAERHLRRVVRNRFGRCPIDLTKLCEPPYVGRTGDDMYEIVYFKQNNGDE